jgi:6-pyruvoyltetrahydropterin/6-carboxytetrahydropterin synthase
MFIEIDGWRSNLRFSACHFIPEYKGAPRVHGYTYTINIRIHGTPNSTGIIIDFEDIKTKLKTIVEKLDHKVIVPRNYVTNKDDTNIYFNVNDKSYSVPADEAVILDLIVPSAEELSRTILNDLKTQFSVADNIDKIELGLDESWGCGAWSSWDIKNGE